MIYFYLVCFLVSFFLLIGFICSDERHSLQQNLLLVITVIANSGYLALAASSNLQEAVLANKITYAGGCFLPMTSFIVVCEICRIRVKSVMLFVMYLVQTLLFLCICTIGYSDIYYSTVSYHMRNGVAYLTKTYGPVHALYVATLFGYVLACIVIAVWSLFRKTVVSYKSAFIILGVFLFGAAGYTVERLLGWQLEIMPMCYTVIFLGVFVPVHKISTYDVFENLKRVRDDRGYVSFDRKLRYMGCNDFALGIFAELKEYTLEDEIPADNSLFYAKVFPAVREYARGRQAEKRLITVGEHFYDISVSPIGKGKAGKTGYMLEISDVTERQNYISMIENYNRNLESEVAGKTHRIREIRDKTVLGMAQMVESRDLSTGGHIKRTSGVVGVFSRELLKSNLGLDRDFLYYVEKSAPMHDLGKIAVDDRILRKQGRFTAEEYEQMKGHSEAGAGIVRSILMGIEDEQFVTIAVNVAHYHHEKVDGSGYPEGLRGEEIPLEARIMALADVFDALVSKRCYKEALSFEEAFSIIEKSAGSHFDPELTKLFLKCRPRLEALYKSFGDGA